MAYIKKFSDEKQKHLKLITENIKMNRQNSFHDIKETEFLKQNEILKYYQTIFKNIY